MDLIPNARKIWLRLWSVRLAMIAAIVQGAAMFWFALEDTMPPTWFFAIGIVLTVAVVPARLLAQKGVTREEP
jgi:uncharacterized membrane protein